MNYYSNIQYWGVVVIKVMMVHTYIECVKFLQKRHNLIVIIKIINYKMLLENITVNIY